MIQEPLQQATISLTGRLALFFRLSVGWDTWIRLPVSLARDDAAILSLILILLASALGGAAVFAFYRYYYRGMPASPRLDASLIPASVLSTLIFYQSGSWPALSVTMVVILGFIHFRTVIKDIEDVAYVFWAVLSGIFIGAGYPLPTLILDLLITLIGIAVISRRGSSLVYLLIIRYNPRIANELMLALQPLHGKIRAQSEKNGLIDLTIEVRLRYISMAVIDRISAMDGVQNAMMVSDEFGSVL